MAAVNVASKAVTKDYRKVHQKDFPKDLQMAAVTVASKAVTKDCP